MSQLNTNICLAYKYPDVTYELVKHTLSFRNFSPIGTFGFLEWISMQDLHDLRS